MNNIRAFIDYIVQWRKNLLHVQIVAKCMC